MTDIFLAFIVGVLFGVGYMYLRYRRVMSDLLRTLEELKLKGARLEGATEALAEIFGIRDGDDHGRTV